MGAATHKFRVLYTAKKTTGRHHDIVYMEFLTSGRLNTYLADINEQATEQILLLTKQIHELIYA